MNENDERIQQARRKWRHNGANRPRFAQTPASNEESVWDYPRPPRVMADRRHILVTVGGELVAETRNAQRVMETGSPPAFYLPPGDVHEQLLIAEARVTTVCEWKGVADYYAVHAGGTTIRQAAWRYAKPFDRFRSIAGYFAFYPTLLECYVDNERVRPQPGGFYGGWVTNELVGPFKGEPGTEDW